MREWARSLTAVAFLAVLSVLAGGCGAGAATSSPERSSKPSPTARPSEPVPSGHLRIEHGWRENAQIIVSLPSGRRVYIDVFSTAEIPPPRPEDVLVTTYRTRGPTVPGDLHEDGSFRRAFPSRTLTYETGQIALPDVTIRSIAARHADAEADGTNHIVIVEAEGLRIVHFGDLGQTSLTAEQLAAVGTPDVAISQLWNPYSGLTDESGKAVGQMRQVRPRLFVPSHTSIATLRQAVATWPSFFHKGSLVLSKADLPAETTMLLVGADADVDGADLGIGPAY